MKRKILLFVLFVTSVLFSIFFISCSAEKEHTHRLIYHQATLNDCDVNGNIEYWQCADCGKYYLDEKGETETVFNNIVIPKTIHTWLYDSWLWDSDYESAKVKFICQKNNSHVKEVDATITTQTNATCTSSGTKNYTATLTFEGNTYTDTKSKLVQVSHNVIKTEEVKATCTTSGNSQYWTCLDCGKYFSNQGATTQIEKDSWIISSLGHNLTCVDAIEPTCEHDGNTEYWTCVNCNNYFSDSNASNVIAKDSWELNAVDHSYVNNVCKWCGGEQENSNTTTTKTAVYDVAVGQYVVPSVVTDENGNEFYRYTLNPTLVGVDNEFDISSNIENGQIFLNDVSESYIVVINLRGVTISCNYDAPIYILGADKVEISAKSGTVNYIKDNREHITAEQQASTAIFGKGAVFAKCDLKFKGLGELNVVGNFNNGLHSTKDLTIQNLTLNVKSYNNALKGNDSINVESGIVNAVSTAGDGLKTSNTDISTTTLKQRGTITIIGGTINVYSAFDGIDASFDVVISGTPVITIYTWTYAYQKDNSIDTSLNSYATTSSSSSSSTTRPGGGFRPGTQGMGGGMQEGNSKSTTYSCKGIVANNLIDISGGTITINSNDDGIHVNNDVVMVSGVTPLGKLLVNGGQILITTEDDGMHADDRLEISSGIVTILNAYEGIEGEFITISGGEVSVYSTDDGLNASNDTTDSESPLITISGGAVNVTVSGADVDGIDSNGNFTQTGGVVAVSCPSSGMSEGLDTDGSKQLTGGTFIVTGSSSLSTSLKSKSISGSYSAGTYSVVSNGVTIFTFNIGGSTTYSSLYIASSLLKSGTSYTLQKSGTTISTWTQT